jgi:hypothetical protein
MAADSLIPSMYVRHTGHELPEIIRASFQILEQLPRMADRVADFRPFNLADAVAQDFAQKALALRYSDPALAPIRAEQLLDIRRGEDAGNSLWAVTNRCQENLLRGGMRHASRVNRAGKPFRPMRATRRLGANVAISIGVRQPAESFRSN